MSKMKFQLFELAATCGREFSQYVQTLCNVHALSSELTFTNCTPMKGMSLFLTSPHPASYPIGTGSFYLGGKAAWA